MKVDFVFVDGAHDIGQVVMEAYWINRLLRPGGTVAFHDGLLASGSVAARYLVSECGYSVVDASESKLRRGMRLVTLRHIPAVGPWHWLHVVPRMCRSLIVLRSPLAHQDSMRAL